MNDATGAARRAIATRRTARAPGRRMVGLAVFWALLIAAPFWLPLVHSYTDLGTRVLIFALAAMGLNLVLGYTGGLSFGQAAYFGLGAYGAGLTLRYWSHNMWLALAAGVLLGGIAATLIGPLVMRRRGIYFAMITIAVGQMFYFVAVRWTSFTGGEDGLSGFQREPLTLFGHSLTLTSTPYYYFVLFFFAIGCFVLYRILNSPLGHSFVAVRENARRLEFLGVKVERLVWISFAISGFITALAGALEAMLNNFTSPLELNWILSGDFVIICVLGGMRNFWGPFVGAIIYVVVQDYVSSVTQNWMTVIGLIFVLAVLFFPRGLLGFLPRRRST
ncbi:MAG: branched-chain amino acid ABC transporter permease [Acetobacteraceae bacterium]